MGMFNYANNEMAIKGSAMVCSTNFGAGPCMEMIFLICGKNKNGAVNVEAVRFFLNNISIKLIC